MVLCKTFVNENTIVIWYPIRTCERIAVKPVDTKMH